MRYQTLIIEPGIADRHYWRDLWRYRELFHVLAWRDISVRYKQTIVGLAWAILQPVPAPGEGKLGAFRALEPFWPFTIWTIVLCTAWAVLVGRGPIEWAIDRIVRFIAPVSLEAP